MTKQQELEAILSRFSRVLQDFGKTLQDLGDVVNSGPPCKACGTITSHHAGCPFRKQEEAAEAALRG